jgi:RNase P subunit RPR2
MPPRPEKVRHVDRGILLASFAGRVIAVCPKCGGPALVTSESRWAVPFAPTHARINCLRCSFQVEPREWLGPVTGTAKSRCPNCGLKWLKKETQRRRLNSRASQYASVACPSCEKITKIPIKWTQERFGSPVDPVVGLPLWLQVSCCGHTLWAYNGEHLSKLGAYVAAGLRERTANKHWSMFSRLPKWMSDGKNREAVLSSINRLDRKLTSVRPKT